MVELFTILAEAVETPDGAEHLKLRADLNATVFEQLSDEETRKLLKNAGQAILSMVDDVEIDRSELE